MTVKLTLEHALEATDGELIYSTRPNRALELKGICIDSRHVETQNAFIAIVGERLDGHQFIESIYEKKPALIIIDARWYEQSALRDDFNYLIVSDTTKALGDIARFWRKKVAPKAVIAITGSVGKTTTKELIKNICSLEGKTHATAGNFNNHIGLPLTILAMPHDTNYLILEMGMSNPGEIRYLSSIALQDISAISKIAPAHLEHMGSIEAIAAAKAEIFLDANPQWVILPRDSLLDPYKKDLELKQIIEFSRHNTSQLQIIDDKEALNQGRDVRLGFEDQILAFNLKLFGEYNTENAACAAAVASALKIKSTWIIEGLERPPKLKNRSSIKYFDKIKVLDDCYNASPYAVKAALKALTELAKNEKKIAICGEMLELGAKSDELHRQIGEYAAKLALNALIVTQNAEKIAEGAISAKMDASTVFIVPDAKSAGQIADELLTEGGWVLVKGSRGAKMEDAIDAILERRSS